MNEKPSRPTPPSGQPNKQGDGPHTGEEESSSESQTAAELKEAKKLQKSLRPWHKKKRFWVLGIIAFLVILGALQNEDTAPVDKSPQGRLAAAVLKESGNTNIKGYGNRIQNVEWTNAKTTIQLLGDENLSEGMTKSSNRRLVLEAITAYQKSGLISDTISIEIFYPLIDNLGNQTLNRVLGYGFSQDRISRIRAENVDPKQMDLNFADMYTSIHPAFRW